MNLQRPAAEVNGMDAGQSFHLVHVYDDTITHSVVPVGGRDGGLLHRRMARADGAVEPGGALEAFSRKR
jgi:hypothetical protein